VSDPPPPKVSPDGKLFWDGEKWQPMPAAAKHYPWTAGPMGCLVAIGLVIVIAAIAGVCSLNGK
jgi:hypothetical protein